MRQGWSYNFLGEISSINYGYTAKASFEADGPKFLRITDIQNGNVNWATVPSCSISEEDYDKHRLFENDIVFARTGATTGKSYLIGQTEDAVAASYLIRLRLECEDVLPAFVTWYFQTTNYWNAVTSGITGSTQGGFNASKLKNLTIPLPPLPEQRRIVAVLDEAFQGIDRAVANTEKNLANARELFESQLNAVFSANDGQASKLNNAIVAQDDVVSGPFPVRRLGELCEVLDSRRKPITKRDRIAGEYPYYGATGILDYVHDYLFDEKLILIGEDGAKWGAGENTAFSVNGKCWVNNHAHVIRPYRTQVIDQWIIYQLNANDLSGFITGLTVSKLNQAKMREIPISLPPLPEQKRIVAILDELKANSTGLVCAARRKLDLLAGLKQSILHKAFAGELTAGEPGRALAEAGA